MQPFASTASPCKHQSEQGVVVRDNVAFHQCDDILEALTEAQQTWAFLPPYSPDLNLIEQVWAKAKAKAILRCYPCTVQELFANESFYVA